MQAPSSATEERKRAAPFRNGCIVRQQLGICAFRIRYSFQGMHLLVYATEGWQDNKEPQTTWRFFTPILGKPSEVQALPQPLPLSKHALRGAVSTHTQLHCHLFSSLYSVYPFHPAKISIASSQLFVPMVYTDLLLSVHPQPQAFQSTLQIMSHFVMSKKPIPRFNSPFPGGQHGPGSPSSITRSFLFTHPIGKDD